MIDSEIARWKKYLRYDPTRWLLETNDPSILLWYQLDIAHRPEDAPGVMETRERVLYSDAVQNIFAAQDALGYWGDAENLATRQPDSETIASPNQTRALAQPYYTATLWNLALLAELGIPPASRRARNACEFILQNFLEDNGTFGELNAVESGWLLRAFGYFQYASDMRVLRAARALRERADSYAARIAALWGWRAFGEQADIAEAAQATLERVLNDIEHASAAAHVPYTFPQFEPSDELFLLRVLSDYDRVNDARAAPLVETLAAKQNERAQWTLESDLNKELVTPLERAGEPSRWITLNALRVIVKLVVPET
jgi:hypothetical protein